MRKTTVAVVVAVLAFLPGTASADVNAHWKMNEHKHQTVLHDSSRAKINGKIGRHIQRNGRYQHFSAVPRGVVKPGRVDVVSDRDRLDPGNKYFAATMTFRWPRGNSDNNLIQKGQGDPAGGMFKMKTTVGTDQPKGQIKCLFRGSYGDSQVESYGHKRLDNDKWHTIKCYRTANGTYMKVDGKKWDHNPKEPGVIRNDWPVAIGGNTYCPSSKGLECNYWHGDLDNARWTIGRK